MTSSPQLQIRIGRANRGIGSLLPWPGLRGPPQSARQSPCPGRGGSREEVIAKYRRWLWEQLQEPGSPQERELRRLLAQARAGELELLY